ncbi:U5 small nuclear ribonucleoprotein helicase [Forsythia ovata]|uniref:U5 small nuclear ribonucleoprotein helicase n=1 Tax=Forsythia ovata TaxID=205694 RepID=A0ABD1TTK6_9LAMI
MDSGDWVLLELWACSGRKGDRNGAVLPQQLHIRINVYWTLVQEKVESTQSMIRIVGLSATLPNYLEVAQFLRVNPEAGLFFFDSSYRPVPLEQKYIGVSEQNYSARNELLNEICYNKVVESLRRGHQVMVFVHSRKDTVKTADKLVEISTKNEDFDLFTSESHPQFGLVKAR